MAQAKRRTRRDKVVEGVAPTPRQPKSIPLVAKTERQATYINALRVDPCVVSIGCAGTGKTYIAMTHAAQLYLQRKIDKIILTRPNVPAGGKSLGYLPGTYEEKVAPWAAPAVDVLKRHLGKQKVEAMMAAEELVFEAFETMRGKSYDNAFVILDEAQNATTDELKMFLTRLGEGTTCALDGDIAQTDLPRNSGLAKLVHMVKAQMLPVPVIEFGVEDIVRSDLCAMWIRAFMAAEKPRTAEVIPFPA